MFLKSLKHQGIFFQGSRGSTNGWSSYAPVLQGEGWPRTGVWNSHASSTPTCLWTSALVQTSRQCLRRRTVSCIRPHHTVCLSVFKDINFLEIKYLNGLEIFLHKHRKTVVCGSFNKSVVKDTIETKTHSHCRHHVTKIGYLAKLILVLLLLYLWIVCRTQHSHHTTASHAPSAHVM